MEFPKTLWLNNQVAIEFEDVVQFFDYHSGSQNQEILSPTPAEQNASSRNGPLARYVKLRVVHATGMPGTFSSPPRVSDPDMHHGTCVTHVSWCMSWWLTSCFLWSRWRGKRSRHSRRMCNPRFYVSGKRPIQNTPRIMNTVCVLLCFVVVWYLSILPISFRVTSLAPVPVK